MTHILVYNPDGSVALDTEAEPGQTLLAVCQAYGLPLEGTCEGAMACSTCHVLIEEADYGQLPPPSEPEEDMLDFAAYVGPTSRLSCQIELTPELKSLTLRLPAGHTNMQGR